MAWCSRFPDITNFEVNFSHLRKPYGRFNHVPYKQYWLVVVYRVYTFLHKANRESHWKWCRPCHCWLHARSSQVSQCRQCSKCRFWRRWQGCVHSLAPTGQAGSDLFASRGQPLTEEGWELHRNWKRCYSFKTIPGAASLVGTQCLKSDWCIN